MNHPVPSEELRAKILRSVEGIPTPPRQAQSLRSAAVNLSAIAVALCLFWLGGGIRVTGRTPPLVIGTALGSLLVAGAGGVLLADRNGSMLGRPRRWLIATAALLPLVLLGWKVYFSSHFAHALDPWSSRTGYVCLGLGVSLGILPLMAFLQARRGTDPSHPKTAGMALGVATGLGVAVLVDLWCPIAYLPHLLLGHILPIVILAFMGIVLGRKVLKT